jgi:imidazolonepropionase-like amidohydrolase
MICLRSLATAMMAFTAAARAQVPAARPPVPGAPVEMTAFVDVGVVPMDTERVSANQTVLVQNGWIAALGPSDKIIVPATAVKIDGRGQYLIPGLGDCHAHLVLRSAQVKALGAERVDTAAGEYTLADPTLPPRWRDAGDPVSGAGPRAHRALGLAARSSPLPRRPSSSRYHER